MDFIFDGFVSWAATILASCLDALTVMFNSAMGTDLTTFNDIFPFAQTAQDVILGLGLSLLFMILIFQLFRNLWGPLADKSVEHPAMLLLRAMVFFPLVYFSKSIVLYVLSLASIPFNALSGLATYDAGQWATGMKNSFQLTVNSFGSVLVLTTGVMNLILLAILVLIGWNYLKLLLEVCERYIVIGIISYTAPLAVATGGSAATNQIFKGWCRLVGSQTLLMIFNIWFLKLISSGLNNVGSYLSVHKGSFLIWALLIVAMEKAAQRMDSYMKSIIGNVAITGGGILDDLVATTSAVKGAMSSLKGGFGGLSGSKGGGGGSPVGPSGSTGGTLGAAVASIGRKFSAASAAADVVGSGGVAQATMGGALFGAGAAIAHAVNGGRFQSSLKNGGKFASSVIGRVAHGNGAKDYGFIQDTAKSATASNSMSHYFGGGSYSNATIGNGEASAQTTGGNVNFYAADSHQVPDAGTYESVTAKDGSQWYKQISKAGSSAPKAPRRL